MADQKPLRVYWQPGCSSCLQAKEFLTRHNISFESINVIGNSSAQRELAELGARSVPAITRGNTFVAGQNLDELAAFAGVVTDRSRLPVIELERRLQALMVHAQGQLADMPKTLARRELRPDRTLLDLSFHVFAIVNGFLDAAQGGALSETYFYQTPDPKLESNDVSKIGAETQALYQAWSDGERRAPDDADLQTYYGLQNLQDLLERSCWHVAQHLRQIQAVLNEHTDVATSEVPADLMAGLPMPDHVWDDQEQLITRR